MAGIRRRALSEEPLRRKTTFDETFEEEAEQLQRKRRRVHQDPLQSRSISEVLPMVTKSLESGMSIDYDELEPQQPPQHAPTPPADTITAQARTTHTPPPEATSLQASSDSPASTLPLSPGSRPPNSPRKTGEKRKSCEPADRGDVTPPVLPPLGEGAAASGSKQGVLLPPADETEEERQARSRCVYIDRISIDVTDAMVKQALDDHLLPQGVKKVQSLEVIRTQKSRHVHAFAILTQTMTEQGILDVPVGGGEYIKVQSAVKQLQIPQPPKVCRTLHIRIYARRSSWAQAARRMTWAGLLCILEFVSPGVTSNINIVADDRSSRSVQSHPENMCCVFFAECPSEDAARAVHEAVHDKTTRGLDDIVFLVRTDYAKGEKKLHDTSVNLDQLRQRFSEAQEYARTAASYRGKAWDMCDGTECPVPEALRQPHKRGIHDCFEFSAKYASPRKKMKKATASSTPTPTNRSPSREPTTSPSRSPARQDIAPPEKPVAPPVGVVAGFDETQPLGGDGMHGFMARDPSMVLFDFSTASSCRSRAHPHHHHHHHHHHHSAAPTSAAPSDDWSYGRVPNLQQHDPASFSTSSMNSTTNNSYISYPYPPAAYTPYA